MYTGQVEVSDCRSLPPAQCTSNSTPTNNLGDCNLALTLTIRHIHSFPRPTDQAFTDARYARNKSTCYHTSTSRNTPKAHTVWVSDTTALRTTTVIAINKRSDSESYEGIYSTVRYLRKSPQLVNFLGCAKILRSDWTLRYNLLHFTYFFSPSLSKLCGSVDWVCLAHDRNSEHGTVISHYILQKKSSLFWTFFCISDFVSCNTVNLYKSDVISFYSTWNGSISV